MADLVIETLLCPNACTYEDGDQEDEPVSLVNGQRCPICRRVALLDDGWEEPPIMRGHPR